MINDLLHVAETIWIGADTPVSLGCFLRAKYGEWEQLARMSVDPSDYRFSDAFKVDNQAVGLLRKCKDLPTGLDLKEAAKKLFFESELLCCRTNARLSRYVDARGPFEDPHDETILEFISNVRKEVHRLVGSAPKSLNFRLGKGSTLSDSGTECTVPHKFSSEPTVTASALHVLPLWAQSAWGRNLRSDVEIRLVDYDSWLSVDKDALKRRGISKQPSVNVASQLSVGRSLRRRLLIRRGINLDVLQHVHRRKACVASLSGDSATIDLSNASDTVARLAVKLTFSHEWYQILDSLRVPFTMIDGKRVYLEKFSGMGNGYTFELETVLFQAICQVASGGGADVSVYGDDLIVPADKAKEVIAALRFFGFIPNLRKTFVTGPFRESCGGDYFLGDAVRPHFQEDEPVTPQGWISFANGLRRVWWDDKAQLFDPRFLKAWFLCLEKIPDDVRACRGPAVLGDIVIHDLRRTWQVRRTDSIRYIRAWLPYTFKVHGWSRFNAGAVFASALYGVSNTETVREDGSRMGIRVKEGVGLDCFLHGVVPRDGVTGYRRAWVPFS